MAAGFLKFLLPLAIFSLSWHSSESTNYQYTAPRPEPMYHFIIIGGGTGGSVVANRLSENPNWNVLVLEEGSEEPEMHRIPAYMTKIQGSDSFKCIPTVPQKTGCFGMYDNVCMHCYGKVLGGTSSVNYMIYSRGNPCDYDLWSASGAIGWSYPEVLPYFLKSERADLRDLENSPYHNRSGVLSVEDVQFRTQLAEIAVSACQQAGYSYVDYNGPFQRGVSYPQANTKDGFRYSVNAAYLQPIRNHRPNLTIKTSARVTKILIDPKTSQAYGVEYLSENQFHFVRVENEVILSAGTVNSAKLLMLSGVGPRKHLQSLGIPVIKDLPVGGSYWDHTMFGGLIVKFNNIKGQTFFPERFTDCDLQRLSAGDPTTIFSSLSGMEALAYLRVPNRADDAYSQICCTNRPHFQVIFSAVSLASDEGTNLTIKANIKQDLYKENFRDIIKTRQSHLSFLIRNVYPQSIGNVKLNSTNPSDDPLIDPRYYEHPRDIEIIYQAVETMMDIINQKSFKQAGAEIHYPEGNDCEHFHVNCKEFWECAIRTYSYPRHEAVGTCRMGSEKDPSTVVNPKLQVHGISKLRVIDASVIPFPMAAHYAAPVIMIAEKGADMIKRDWLLYGHHHYANQENQAKY